MVKSWNRIPTYIFSSHSHRRIQTTLIFAVEWFSSTCPASTPSLSLPIALLLPQTSPFKVTITSSKSPTRIKLTAMLVYIKKFRPFVLSFPLNAFIIIYVEKLKAFSLFPMVSRSNFQDSSKAVTRNASELHIFNTQLHTWQQVQFPVVHLFCSSSFKLPAILSTELISQHFHLF